jgi:integrase
MTQVRAMTALANDYLTERGQLGFDLTIQGSQIKTFARFVDESGHTGPLTIQVVLGWVKGRAKNATPFSWARRLETLRPFARYLIALDPVTEFPKTAIFGGAHRRLTPHIYSDGEIGELMAAARCLPPAGTLRPITYETIFGLIAATGLRISEAMHLRCGDVDLEQDLLTVRKTKFCKSRHVPLHATTVAALRRYLEVRTRHGDAGADAPMFLSIRGRQLSTRMVHHAFQALRARQTWINRGAHPEIRIHDLRHTFICRRVLLWYDGGADIDNAMAALSTYVGHVKISDTYWYLTGVPDLMAVAGRRFEDFAAVVDQDSHD